VYKPQVPSPAIIDAMNGFVDIHAHPLPGIDDGPPDLAGAVEMARAAARAGTRTLAATPHLRSDFPGVVVGEIPDRCRQLSAELTTAGIDVRIVSGAETSLVWALGASDEQLVAASYDGRGGDLLVETPADVSMIEELLYRIRLRGIRVTLAHPERSRAFQSD
jgi:protein-tyrosine phosphatase